MCYKNFAFEKNQSKKQRDYGRNITEIQSKNDSINKIKSKKRNQHFFDFIKISAIRNHYCSH